MAPTTRVISRSRAVKLGNEHSRLSFVKPHSVRAGEGYLSRRLLVDGAGAFELAYWCGTCPIVFERLDGASKILSSEELQRRLNSGVSGIDAEVIAAASEIVPEGKYLPLLLAISPTLVIPSSADDYFANEQVALDVVDQWDAPENPGTPYYRAGSWRREPNDFFFQFAVPMVPPSWNERSRVDAYEREIRAGAKPTILALSLLDRSQPFDSVKSHTALIHFILDGHHKIEAAARFGAEVTMLCLVSLSDSQSVAKEVKRLDRVLKSPVIGL